MQGTQDEIDNAIAVLVETELLEQIKVIYEDVTTTGKIKKQKREQITKIFVESYSEKLLLAKGRIGGIVDKVISNARWIKEIEEIDDER